jgi:hypothetical protein
MTTKKVKFSAPVSPVGIAQHAWINKPAAPYEGKGEPQYKITLLLEDTKENRAWADGAIATALAEAKTAGIKIKKVFNNPFTYPEDVDEDDFVVDPETGKSKLDESYRGKIYFTAKSQYQPGMIDTAREPLAEDVRIMSGDEVRVKVTLNPYEGLGSGVSLRATTVQLVAKNTSFSGGPRTDGFDDIDGYQGNSSSEEEEQF